MVICLLLLLLVLLLLLLQRYYNIILLCRYVNTHVLSGFWVHALSDTRHLPHANLLISPNDFPQDATLYWNSNAGHWTAAIDYFDEHSEGYRSRKD
jgi:hypothetical protein